MNVPFCEVFNRYQDKLVRLEFHVQHKPWPAFQVCGYTGLVLAVFLAVILVAHLELSIWVMVGIVLVAVLTFFGLAMITKIITGEEQLIYYHHEIAVMIVATGLLWLLHQPILPYLDATILGVGLFLACGRVGCLMVGCCHGRPHRWGVCYCEEHAAAGFTPYFVGVRLFPIQAVESLWVFGTVLVGSALVLTHHPPGAALAWYVVSYDIGRFCFEFLRGDPARPYRWGFSEAQWTSLLLMFVVAGLEMAGLLPFQLWHIGATAGLAVAIIVIALRRHFQKTDRHQLLHPRHLKEVAEAVELVSNLTTDETTVPKGHVVPANIHIGCTSLGVQISAGKIRGEAGCLHHYALSCQDGRMTEEAAQTVAKFILQLKHPSWSNELVCGSRGVFHLLVRPAPG